MDGTSNNSESNSGGSSISIGTFRGVDIAYEIDGAASIIGPIVEDGPMGVFGGADDEVQGVITDRIDFHSGVRSKLNVPSFCTIESSIYNTVICTSAL